MKIQILKITLISLVLLILYAFGSYRNTNRKISEISVNVVKQEHLLIDSKEIKKQLSHQIDSIYANNNLIGSLGILETLLERNSLVQNAEIYKTVDGVVHATVYQRKPIVRIIGQKSYYLDSLGTKMSKKMLFHPRVPIFYASSIAICPNEISLISKYLYNDIFLSKNITGFWQNKNKEYLFEVRQYKYIINMGTIKNYKQKLKNYKMFYQRMLSNNKLYEYKQLILKYNNQIICKK